jgi:putative SOS response-associated peptidase YedK
VCGRFVLFTIAQDLAGRFGCSEFAEIEPRYNIAPTQPIAVVRNRPYNAGRQLKLVKWGLIPYWFKDPKIANKLINAKAETLTEKPAFRDAFKRRRCLVPVNGFYEWEKSGAERRPYYFHAPNEEPFALAGLWETWRNPEGAIVETAIIITTDSIDPVAEIHDRMPLILRPEFYDPWLDSRTRPDKLQDLVKQTGFTLIRRRVGKQVNKADYESPECITTLQ